MISIRIIIQSIHFHAYYVDDMAHTYTQQLSYRINAHKKKRNVIVFQRASPVLMQIKHRRWPSSKTSSSNWCRLHHRSHCRPLFPKQPMPPMAGRLADVEHTCGVWIKRPWNGANRLVRTAQIRHMPQPARDRVTII
jgi:hypothetical protein